MKGRENCGLNLLMRSKSSAIKVRGQLKDERMGRGKYHCEKGPGWVSRRVGRGCR